MAYLSPNILDFGLDYLTDFGSHLYICSAEPTTYAEASSTYALGVKAGPTISTQAARAGGGRKVTVSAITDGTVSVSDDATHFAIVYATGSELLAVGPLGASVAVSNGNTFTLTAFDVGIPGPA